MSSYIQVPSHLQSQMPVRLCVKLDKVLEDIGMSDSVERNNLLRVFRKHRVNYDLLVGLAGQENNFDDPEVMTPIVLYNVF